MNETGNDLAELLWDNGPAALRRPPPPFQPFTCSAAATTTTPHDLFKNLVRGGHDDDDLAAHAFPLREDHNDDDAAPWLHYPVVDDDDDADADADTAPLPPDYCSALLSGFSDLPPASAVGSSREPCPSSHGAVVPSTPAAPPPQQPETVTKQPRPSGEGGVMNFTFFSRPLQRPFGGESASAAGTSSVPVESTVVQATTNRLRSTPLFSEQRMAWLQPPKLSSRAAAAAAPPPQQPAPAASPLVPTTWQRVHTAAKVTQRLPPSEARAPDAPPPAAAATTSSVCSGNSDRSQLKRRDSNQSAEWSASQDELDLDDEAGGAHRRSAARSSKRSRTAEVHNLSERRRRDRINEKMRALQELIPNCNKIDKASMLEEAIEYLKTLQLQVQMMSMGTGLCVPPMMLPAAAAMQHHLQMQQMAGPMAVAAHFPHLGAAAMGLAGFGMAGAAFDMVPMPHLAAAQLPCPMFTAAPPLAMFGPPLGQSMLSPPPFPHAAATAGEQTTRAPGGADAGDAPVVPQGHERRQQPKQT